MRNDPHFVFCFACTAQHHHASPVPCGCVDGVVAQGGQKMRGLHEGDASLGLLICLQTCPMTGKKSGFLTTSSSTEYDAASCVLLQYLHYSTYSTIPRTVAVTVQSRH